MVTTITIPIEDQSNKPIRDENTVHYRVSNITTPIILITASLHILTPPPHRESDLPSDNS